MKKISALFLINLILSTFLKPIEVNDSINASAKLEEVLASRSDSDLAALQDTRGQIDSEAEILKQTLPSQQAPLEGQGANPRVAKARRPVVASASQTGKVAIPGRAR